MLSPTDASDIVLAPSLSRVIVTVPASNQAAGIFGFNSSQPQLTVAEDASVIEVTVMRAGGMYGNVSVLWSVDESCITSSEFNSTKGTLEFANGDTQQV